MRPPGLAYARTFWNLLRDPGRLLRALTTKRLQVLFRIVSLIPGPIRRPLARPIAVAVDRLVSRGATSARAAQSAFIARWAAGDVDRAREIARSIGTSDAAPAATRRGLALLALTSGNSDVGLAILDTIPEDRLPAFDLFRARLAVEAGRYREAQDQATNAASGGWPEAARLADRVTGHLTVLIPGWTPELGRHAERLRRIAGPGTPGRILHLVAVSLPQRVSGYTIRTQSVARCQVDAGLDAHVATRAGFPLEAGVVAGPKVELVEGVRYHRVSPHYTSGGRQDRLLAETARATIALVEELRPAGLQPASNHLQAQVALALARPLGIPVVYEMRGFWEESWAARQGLDEDAALEVDRYRMSLDAENAAMVAADAVVTLSDTMCRAIVERGIPAEKVTVVPNAVDIDKFRPLPRDTALAASLGIDARDHVVGYVTSLTPYEGIGYLLEAAATLRATGMPVRVLLVGDGEERARILEASRRLGLDDGGLIMAGRVDHAQVGRYYSLIDVFVVPRTADRVSRLVTPIKPYEAMALERPVVVSDLPALREIVTPGQTGMTFVPEDSDDLAQVLRTLLDDPGLRARLGRQAREWVAAERSWSLNGRRYRELYQRLGVA